MCKWYNSCCVHHTLYTKKPLSVFSFDNLFDFIWHIGLNRRYKKELITHSSIDLQFSCRFHFLWPEAFSGKTWNEQFLNRKPSQNNNLSRTASKVFFIMHSRLPSLLPEDLLYIAGFFKVEEPRGRGPKGKRVLLGQLAQVSVLGKGDFFQHDWGKFKVDSSPLP